MGRILKLGTFIGLFLFVLTLATTVHAVNDNSSNNSERKIKQFKATESNDSSKSARKAKNLSMVEKKATQAAIKKVRLSEARLRVCENRENIIAKRFRTLLVLGVNTHKGKEKMVERVDAFYTNVLVPKGYTLPNYASLKADIAAKEANVQTILDEAKASGAEFSCDSDDPKAMADAFRLDMQELIAANKEYRASVKAFVVAVRDLAKKAKADKGLSPSPAISPVISPVVTPEVTEGPGI